MKVYRVDTYLTNMNHRKVPTWYTTKEEAEKNADIVHSSVIEEEMFIQDLWKVCEVTREGTSALYRIIDAMVLAENIILDCESTVQLRSGYKVAKEKGWLM